MASLKKWAAGMLVLTWALGLSGCMDADPPKGEPVETQTSPGARVELLSGVLTAVAARALANGAEPARPLTSDERKMVSLTREMEKTPGGRAMLHHAESTHAVYAFRNNMDGGGQYDPNANMIVLELKEDRLDTRDARVDYTSDDAFYKRLQNFKRIFRHEHMHLYQAKVRVEDAPAGLSSFDRVLWYLAKEAQAIMFEEEETEALRPGENALARRWLYSTFTNVIASDNFHPDYYKIKETRCDDGRSLTRDEFVRAFGFLPGAKTGAENFLYEKLGNVQDVYNVFAKNYHVRNAAGNTCLIQAPAVS